MITAPIDMETTVNEWIQGEPESKLLDVDEIAHVTSCIWSLIRWYNAGSPLGGFLTAVLRNDFMGACGNADKVNRKVLSLYAKFVYNHLPGFYKVKIKEEKRRR